ncbi:MULTISPECIES: NTP transferase domain-containing protein [unclassified Microbacterium]|uniref:molybdenum cofactor guanylyltransferase n=1 Tax=unclassified Microbacterium TaxID=2609290 RepID=UPI00214B5B0E|nr:MULTISPECIES: NTP transferase domain-containing protein [unclassified Microbacterium]MCR2783842.1 NTP transferase domain-containing protein [Microbacterium sp. zg.B96]WIM15310.1 NTP transferase domain-containing protein [Microbacterium sp. zg-B96]
MSTLAAILLAGGRATRVDGAAKPLFDVGGRTLLRHSVEAAAAVGATPITIVGPQPDAAMHPEVAIAAAAIPAQVTWVREDPPFGGPAAGIAAALASWDADPEWTLVLACDLPGAGAAAARLIRDMVLLPTDTEGLCLADATSRPQWLTGVYRTAALRRGAAALPARGHGASMRELLDDLAIATVVAPPAETADVDTWEDLTEARRRFTQEDSP